ncbi:MAG TPA: RidA family protein [Phototrophicaceae bacterium]|nr:RidA family protein [Phototrophicaceae bacterium]
MTMRHFNPPGLSKPVGYSHIAEVTGGKTIYISGQIALDADGNLVGGNDMRKQTMQVFKNIQTALTAVGADFSSVVKLTYFVVNMVHMPVVREVRDQFIHTENPPASSAFEVKSLVRSDLLIEIEAIAVVPLQNP